MSNNVNIRMLLIAVGALIVVLILIALVLDARDRAREREHRQQIRAYMNGLASNSVEMTPEAFLAMRNASFGGRGNPHYSNRFNFTGIYVLINHTQNMCYVGQATRILDRVAAHFSGRGNGDVYADYRNGNRFTIRAIALANSGFASLDALEKAFIQHYGAYTNGYNRNRGNS